MTSQTRDIATNLKKICLSHFNIFDDSEENLDFWLHPHNRFNFWPQEWGISICQKDSLVNDSSTTMTNGNDIIGVQLIKVFKTMKHKYYSGAHTSYKSRQSMKLLPEEVYARCSELCSLSYATFHINIKHTTAPGVYRKAPPWWKPSQVKDKYLECFAYFIIFNVFKIDKKIVCIRFQLMTFMEKLTMFLRCSLSFTKNTTVYLFNNTSVLRNLTLFNLGVTLDSSKHHKFKRICHLHTIKCTFLFRSNCSIKGRL